MEQKKNNFDLVMLSLYRSNLIDEAGENPSKDNSEYFIMDYFDWMKKEILKWDESRLSDCMGIRRNANDKRGISHQRYCLYGERGQGVFEDEKRPVLTVIQIFINPELYQFQEFEDKSDVSRENCMHKVQTCIESYVKSRGKSLKWGIYSLLTEGDFAVVVRSNQFHDAYDLSSLIRNIGIKVGESKAEAFHTYSISGIYVNKENAGDVKWTGYLSKDDRVVIRMNFSQRFRQGNGVVEKGKRKELLCRGSRLFGRYDYQIECSAKEFENIYPSLLDFKLGKSKDEYPFDNQGNDNASFVLWMLHNGYVSQINEKLLLRYEADEFIEGKGFELWNLNKNSSEKWISLYKKNQKEIDKLKERIQEIEGEIAKYYMYERNLKEYTRLLGRLCRVFYEINKLRELQVSLSILIEEYKVFVASIEQYLKTACTIDKKNAADILAENLKMGIVVLEIYTRYIRSINLQTLQTPNYDLQTNVCVEKILLAYSQFLVPFLNLKKTEAREERYPYLSHTLYPIVVPMMEVSDLSVMVLFDDDHSAEEDMPKLMAVSSPTFLNLCESCFLIPIIFHEIAHQFRYESMKERNNCLENYILKSLVFRIVVRILAGKDYYNLEQDKMTEGIVEKIYAELKKCLEINENQSLENFRFELKASILQYIETVLNRNMTLDALVNSYFTKVQGDVCDYNSDMTDAIYRTLSALDDWKSSAGERLRKGEEQEKYQKVVQSLETVGEVQQKQLMGQIKAQIEKMSGKIEMGKFSSQLEKVEKADTDHSICDDERKTLYEMWNEISENLHNGSDNLELKYYQNELEKTLKKYHNFILNYRDIRQKMEEDPARIDYQTLQKVQAVNESIYRSIRLQIEKCIRERGQKLSWDTSTISTEELELILRKIKIEDQKTKIEELQEILEGLRLEVSDHVDNIIEMYREVTSDLYMCGIMGLNIFGYLVMAAEYFELRVDNEEGLLTRIFWVLQCIAESDGKLDNLDKYLCDELYKQTVCLKEGLLKYHEQYFKNGKRMLPLKREGGLENIRRFLNSIDENAVYQDSEMSGNTASTQKWIVRIYKKIAEIVSKLEGRRSGRDVIGEKDMWKDLTSEDAYYAKRESLQKDLGAKSLGKLCEGIAEILNCPAKFYQQRKSLLKEEIEFILEYYEESCRSIWREEVQ